MDLDATPPPKMIGSIAVHLEEENKSDSSIIPGWIGYSKVIEAQLEALTQRRIVSGDFWEPTDEEIKNIGNAVSSRVEFTVSSNQWTPFGNQQDTRGSAYRAFQLPVDDPANDADIKLQFCDLP